MCGIIGYIGKSDAKRVLVDGLKALEYRGYDSSGIAYKDNNQITIIKSAGKVTNLENKIDWDKETHIGIGHTRWATHGIPNEKNAHPHHIGHTTLVHNGIIENYVELKNELSAIYSFNSETDTEVACALIDKLYGEYKDKLKALNEAKKILKGSYALAIIFDDELDSIYAIRKDSPLIVAKTDDEYFLASDIAALLKYTSDYYLLEKNEYVKINKNGLFFYDDNLKIIDKKINHFNGTVNDVMKQGYDHFMLKEIHDEIDVYKKIINEYVPNFDIKELANKFGDFSQYEKITIVGCGSAYHAGLVSKYLFENYANVPTNVEMASEYRYKKIFFDSKELVILISQSGETADTLEALRKAKENKSDTLGIINVLSSSIARESDKVIYCLAGTEIAVATTKAYLAQVLVLNLLSLLMSYQKGLIKQEEANNYLNDLKKLINSTKTIIDNSLEYDKLAKTIFKKKDMFFIGRNIDYALCMEASLKMKEISYIHSEAYAAGELKHGTISLIEEDTVVIGIITDKKIADKTISNLKETKARGSRIILVIDQELFKKYQNDHFYNDVIVVDKLNDFIEPLIITTPLQLLAYYVALYKGESIDQPRNLAKSVTVE